MQVYGLIGSAIALRRKLRALAAVIEDPGATAPEKANAEALKKRLESRLRASRTPAGDWTDHAFRLGRRVRKAREIHIPEGGPRGLDGQRPPPREGVSPRLQEMVVGLSMVY